ncbi:scar-like domain-containing protein WAVE 5 isoform X2 [Arabidopsis lyrata subsp. lyrata]|uniref:scar-like domain-containing protein WAVE 5 isoform X2 n=1 Tax=Arabidopsis lyrata subsp. lyrata TaxID=81972 RepID=UPI000A29E753|nr:scar-like domain-containing protein WAVE 5 isoform X2 [Arabidopsis lyrata subsp. lyrata]|eukprot:XP_020872784.1 scar-like domain-containing protein WAVE 5 isoform X2 [Arabidopsis lyrata subsp. lyrata]
MPLVRFKIRNELSLGGPEIQRSAAVEDEEPKAILGAVEVAGLIGILRQLGDLAEFSAEVFNGLQEEVTVTASRCQKLTSRVRRIESALSPLEKAVLSQTSHIHFAYTAGSEWHPRIRNGHSHFVQSDLPLCVMESYEQCRDPPPLHLLDRFAEGGPGSCLRKYSDPTFFRKELSNPSKTDDIKVQRDQAHRKRKKKRLPQRNICRSNAVSTSDETSGAHLSNLTDDRQTTSQSTSTVDMPRSSNMQDLSDTVDQSHLQGQSDAQERSEAQVQSDFQESSKARDSITGSGYIEYVINQSPVNEPDVKLVEGFLSGSLQPADRIGSAVPAGCIEVVDDNILYSPSEDLHVPCASIVCDEKKETLESMVEKSSEDDEPSEIHESKFGPVTPDRVRQNQRDFDRTYILFDEVDIVGEKQSKSQANNINGTLGIENEGENKSEQESEADEFLDARNTIESESESDIDGVPKPKLEHYFGDISTYCSEDANSENNDGSEDIQYEEMANYPRHENSEDESCSGSYFFEDSNVSCCMSDPVCEKTLSHDENSQKPWEFFASCPSLLAEKAFPDVTILREEPVAAHPLLAGDWANEKISSEEPIFPYPSLKDAIPAEKILPEEHLVNYPSLAEAIPREKISPGESIAKYPSFAEIVPQEKILSEKSLPKTPSLEEAVPDNMTPAGEPDATHPSFPEAVQDKKLSPEVLDSKFFSVPEAVSQEPISLEEFDGIYPCLAEAVHDERFLTEEPSTTCLSLTKAIPIEKVLPEKPLESSQYLAELTKEEILQEKTVDSTHPSCAKAAAETNLSQEVLDALNLSVTEAVPQEKISLEEFVGINPCLVETVPDERLLPEEPVTTYLSLTKAVAIEKVLSEEILETYHSLAELPEEEISQEETDDATHTSEAVSDEGISPEVSDSTNLSLENALPQEQISLEEFVGINQCLAEAVPDERFLPEKPFETYSSLAELQEEKILHEEADDGMRPCLSEAFTDEQISPKVLDYTNSPVAEAVPHEQTTLEDFVGRDPCLVEAVHDKRVLPEEQVTSCIYLTNVVPIEEVLPEEPLDVCASLGKLPKDKISQEKSDEAIHPSCAKTESHENFSLQVLDSSNLSVAEAIPREQTTLDEFVGVDPCLGEAVLDERVLPEEIDTTCLSLTKAPPIKTIFPEEPPEVYPSLEELPEEKISQEKEAAHPYFSEAVCDEKISPLEDPGSTHPSLEESDTFEETSHEELVGTNPFLELAVPNEMGFPDEPGVTYRSVAEAVSKGKNLPEEPLPTYPSWADVVPDEKISGEELHSTNPSSAEAVFDENISGSEAPGCTTETGPHNKTFPEEPFAMDISLNEAVFKEKIPGSEASCSTTETVPHNKTFPEEPFAMENSLNEAVFDEKISGSEASSSTTETNPHNKTFTEEPFATENSLNEADFDEKIPGSEAPGSATETGPHNKSFLEEPVARDISLNEAVFDEKIPGSEASCSTRETVPHNETFPGEPVATDLSLVKAVFDERIPGSEDSSSSIETGLHNKTFPGEPVATELSLTEAGFDEKIPGSGAPSSTTETGSHNKTFSEEPVPNENILPKEPAAAYLALAEGIPDQKVFLDDAALLLFAEAIFDQKFSPEFPDSTYPSLKEPEMHVAAPSLVTDLPAKNIKVKDGEVHNEPYSASDVSMNQKSGLLEPESTERTIPSSGGTDTISPDTQKSLPNGTSVESISIWSNGGLLGLAPLKPPVFAEPNAGSQHIQNEINEASVLSTRTQESSSRSVETTEKSSLPLVVSDPTSQQHSNMSRLSPMQSTGTSFRVFGLSHRLLMAGFGGNSSSTCKFESVPSSSYVTGVASIEDKTQQTPGGSSFEEQLDYESSLFGSPTSSPPVEHMKISFNPIEASPVPKLKLRIPCQPRYNGENADMFPSFQLVPEASNSEDDDDNSDTFCQSSPCASDNCLSDSELWESDESPRKSVSSLKQVEERSRHGDMGSFSGSFLDLPCYDAVDHQSTSSRLEPEQVPEYKPSVSEIIRHWPPNQPKSSPSNEANLDANTVLKKTQDQSLGYL